MKLFKKKQTYSQYITSYQKEHYKQFHMWLSEEEYTILNEYCELKGVSKASLVRQAIQNIVSEYIELKKKER